MKLPKLSRRSTLLLAAAAALAAAGIYCILALNGIGLSCPFYQITGLQCPGCGNSRAVLALLRLDIRGALSYNYLFPLELFYIGWVLLHCCRAYLKGRPFSYKPPFPWLDVCFLTVVLLWWITRNLI